MLLWNMSCQTRPHIQVFRTARCMCIASNHTGVCFNMKTTFPDFGIFIMKIRWSWDHLTFIMGIPMFLAMLRYHLHYEMAFWVSGDFFEKHTGMSGKRDWVEIEVWHWKWFISYNISHQIFYGLVLLSFVVVILLIFNGFVWFIYPYLSGLPLCENVPVPLKLPWNL